MAGYDGFVEDSQYLAALKDRSKAYANVERYIRRLNLSASKPPNVTVFRDLHLEIKEVIKILDQKQSTLQELIAENCEDYISNEAYIENLDSYDSAVFEWLEKLSKESDRVYGSSTPVKADENSGSIAEMVSLIKDQSAQMKMQNDQIKDQSDQIKAQSDRMES